VSFGKSHAQQEWKVTSPDKALQLILRNTNGALQYRIVSGAAEIVKPSSLGIEQADASFSAGLSFVSTTVKKIDERYTMRTGKRLQNHAVGNETSVLFRNPGGVQLRLDLRAYNDGVAFRYVFPGNGKKITVTDETTEFALAPSGRFWAQPYDLPTEYTPAYESTYENGVAIGTAARDSGGWAFPALFQTAGHWMLLTESNLTGKYFAAHLQQQAAGSVYKLALPLHGEGQGIGAVTATAATPFATPWRTFMIGKNLGTIVESSLVHHLADPNELGNVSWVTPGRASWSWWSDHASSKDYQKLKSFVDLAKEMGWEYSLVDANWNIMEGGTVEQLIKYADSQKVKLALWYNSGGPHNVVTEQPRDIMNDPVKRKAELKRLHDLGIKGIKVDFFQSDKQPIIQEYFDILTDAAKEQIVVDFHGCTLPRGWERTYPNLLSMEAVRGAENYGWGKDFALNAPVQNNIFPYTRNVVGSMDFTPVTFTDYECCPHITTNAHELALTVLFETGVLHFADRVSAYQAMDPQIKNFVRTVPVVWDDTKFIQGEPGQETVLARRSGNSWYIAGTIGDSTQRTFNIRLPFLTTNYKAMLFSDGTLPREIKISERIVSKNGLEVPVLPHGGFVLVLTPVARK
jgi:hypothetical protein